ncbi:hypothetical protein [Mesorhizobium sp. M2A.F.Ca.ET.039.01.1.1]|uniref:hypothetical protein n=1 Tax=Mesorhizobium sp. M2A.F.Ca.ET.039.01.1.1 TaxID=2496746 RepID=UPI0016720973|nr:hypothetical protein [Mesorhizobium sp. M2A.F.Ca.ET.039.01.1.1]
MDVEGPVGKMRSVAALDRSQWAKKRTSRGTKMNQSGLASRLKRSVARAVGADLTDDAVFELGPPRLALLASKAPTARQKTPHMDDAAQAVDGRREGFHQ